MAALLGRTSSKPNRRSTERRVESSEDEEDPEDPFSEWEEDSDEEPIVDDSINRGYKEPEEREQAVTETLSLRKHWGREDLSKNDIKMFLNEAEQQHYSYLQARNALIKSDTIADARNILYETKPFFRSGEKLVSSYPGVIQERDSKKKTWTVHLGGKRKRRKTKRRTKRRRSRKSPM
jgi:hypothetical protein